MTTPTKRPSPGEIAKRIACGNYGLDFERALIDAITTAIAEERERAEKLVEALERIANGTTIPPEHALSDQEIARQALAEYRKGDEG